MTTVNPKTFNALINIPYTLFYIYFVEEAFVQGLYSGLSKNPQEAPDAANPPLTWGSGVWFPTYTSTDWLKINFKLDRN